jgi:hypothetical protein
MGILGRIFGTSPPGPSAPRPSDIDRAVERYRQLLRSESPEAAEEAYRAAFAQLTKEQRVEVLRVLSQELDEPTPPGADADPETLSHAAKRMEVREPGSVERALRRAAATGVPYGGLIGAVALGFVAPAIVHGIFADDGLDDLGDYD